MTALFAGSLAAQTSHATSTAKSTAHHHRRSTATHVASASTTAVAHRSTTSKSGTAKSARSKSGKKPVVAVAHRSYQQQPTPDRYREIQQALADKGYFAGQPDGAWGPDSVESLKRFQHDQNLTEDGKIGSLSLIALGLGPRRAPIDAGSSAVAPQSNAAPQIPQH